MLSRRWPLAGLGWRLNTSSPSPCRPLARHTTSSVAKPLALVLSLVGFSMTGAGPARAEAAKAPSSPIAGGGSLTMSETSKITYEPATFADLANWHTDDHLAAWKGFVASCGPVLKAAAARSSKAKAAKASGAGVVKPSRGLLDLCELALLTDSQGGTMTRKRARDFFETNFVVRRVSQSFKPSMLTGYYEPLVEGSFKKAGAYQTPVYRRPADLVNVVAESERGARDGQFTHMRQVGNKQTPYATRAEIDGGALKGLGLELMYFRDAVDVFFMQIQGSARIKLPNGKTVRITYDGKNGHPYTSIGRYLIDSGELDANRMSLAALTKWLKSDRARGQRVMWQNKSYVFFRTLEGEQAQSAMGVLGIPLQPGRSLAVDTAYHAIGTPIFVDAPEITHASSGKHAGEGFARLMIAHDVGSAIKGPERGDIYFGSGQAAGKRAGITKHPGRFFVLQPRHEAEAQTARHTP